MYPWIANPAMAKVVAFEIMRAEHETSRKSVNASSRAAQPAAEDAPPVAPTCDDPSPAAARPGPARGSLSRNRARSPPCTAGSSVPPRPRSSPSSSCAPTSARARPRPHRPGTPSRPWQHGHGTARTPALVRTGLPRRSVSHAGGCSDPALGLTPRAAPASPRPDVVPARREGARRPRSAATRLVVSYAARSSPRSPSTSPLWGR